MALTGDLSQLHIADIIQLIHTTRKSGAFIVKGSRGESRIIFSNGYMVGASHLNNRVRIGTVLVKMNAITSEDLKQALDIQKKAGTQREPLLATLRHLGKLKDDAAFKGLKKLIEIAIVELISWNEGTFTFDSEEIAVSQERKYAPGEMEQEMSLDAQMVLMDALRIFDERERDRMAGKEVPSYEEFFAEVLPNEVDAGPVKAKPVITADILGLADVDLLENKIRGPVVEKEAFDPVSMHRAAIRQALADFPEDEQEAFVSFLIMSAAPAGVQNQPARQDGQGRALILFSTDELIKYAVMTICKNDGILVFATAQQDELDRIITQCLLKQMVTVLVFDMPTESDNELTSEKILSLQKEAKRLYPRVLMLQFASPRDFAFTLKSFQDGMSAVLPRPARETSRETFIMDMIAFLETFRTYISGFSQEQCELAVMHTVMKLKERVLGQRWLEKPADVSLNLLQAVAEICDRSIAFSVSEGELIGEQAMGVYAPRKKGPTPASHLKIPLEKYSVFRDILESGQIFFGEADDDVLQDSLHKQIGKPLMPSILLLPLKSGGQTRTLIYGDFARKDVPSLSMDVFEIIAYTAGLVLENVQYRDQILKNIRKQ